MNININEIHIFELRVKIELGVDHRSEGVSTEAVEKNNLKKFRFNGNQTHDLCDRGATF